MPATSHGSMMSAMPSKPLTLLALCVTDQGNLALLKLICDSAEGRTFHGVNDGASKSQAPLMRACMHGCVVLFTWHTRHSPSQAIPLMILPALRIAVNVPCGRP